MAAYPLLSFSKTFNLLVLAWVIIAHDLSIVTAKDDDDDRASRKMTIKAGTTTKIRPASSSNTTRTSRDCLPLVEPIGWRRKAAKVWRRRRDTPTLAYRMMVLSALSYWEFHKRPLEDHVFGFSLLSDVPARTNITRIGGDLLKSAVSWLASVVEPASIVVSRVQGVIKTNETTQYTYNPIIKKQAKGSKNTRRRSKKRIKFQYQFFDWHEKGVAGVKFHDTDVLISTMEDDGSLIITFAGTASAADAVTNIQTFEPANHSGFYHGGKKLQSRKQNTTTTTPSPIFVEGSLHRGFLNALTRVDQGHVLRLGSKNHHRTLPTYLTILHEHFGNCTMPPPPGEKISKKATQKLKTSPKSEGGEQTQISSKDGSQGVIMPSIESATPQPISEETSTRSLGASTIRPRRKGGCTAKGKKLLSILQEVITSALQEGRGVHLTGHSLGGGLASHMALDLVVNFPHVPVKKLHLWTFGAPQIADSIFLESVVQMAPRLRPFVTGRNGRYHRFVTVSDDCRPDVVSEVTKQSLPSHQRKGLHGKVARRLGGVHGSVVHVIFEPHYLLTPQQVNKTSSSAPTEMMMKNDLEHEEYPTDAVPITTMTSRTTKTHSTVAAHATINYLQGISRESRHHPLQTDLPDAIRKWVGEIISV